MSNSMARAFLDAILADPDDDTPRLVYADWLDEHGDSARAEFIRVQCEKARLPRWHRSWLLLAARERVLLAQHGDSWRAELPYIEDVEWREFERGFVHEVETASSEPLVKHAEQIRASAPINKAFIRTWIALDDAQVALPFLRTLRFRDEGVLYTEPDRLFQSPLFSTLKSLDLSDANLEGEHFAALGRSTQLAGLETLILDDCYMGGGNLRPFTQSLAFGNLSTLSMKGNRYGYHEDARVGPSDVALLADSPNLALLTSLNLAGNEIDAVSLRRLLGSPHLSCLLDLNVADNRLAVIDSRYLGNVNTRIRLHSLSLARNPIGDLGAAALARASYCANLVDLDLDTCEITAKGIGALAKAPWFARLARLKLDHNSLGADGIHALCDTLNSGELFELHLRDNELDAEAVALLAESSAMKGLHTLDLSENSLDEVGLKALATSPSLSRLHVLHLDQSGLDAASMRSLRGAAWLPGLTQLSLSNNALNADALRTLCASGGLLHLHDLSLASCGLSDQDVHALANAGLAELHWLDLSNNKIGPQTAQTLAESRLAASLVELELSGNTIGDEGAAWLAAGSWPLLTRLGLASNKITNKGLNVLASAKTMPRLQEVRCRNNRIEWQTFRELGSRFRQY